MTGYQATLLGAGEPQVDDGAAFERTALDEHSWIDVARGWLAGADTLLDALIPAVDWRRGRRRMWERMVDDPRLSRWYAPGAALPHPALEEIGAAIEYRYERAFTGPALNYYRDGRDSVASHADRELRGLDDTLVAIVTLGARRPFHVRRKEGGCSLDLAPASGDLLVMGGATQLRWTHAVPKVARAGPRISVSWRWSRRD